MPGRGADQRDVGLIRRFEQILAQAEFYRVMLGKNGYPVCHEKIRPRWPPFRADSPKRI